MGEGGRDGHGFIGLDSVANRVDYAREPLEGEWAYILNAATTNDDRVHFKLTSYRSAY